MKFVEAAESSRGAMPQHKVCTFCKALHQLAAPLVTMNCESMNRKSKHLKTKRRRAGKIAGVFEFGCCPCCCSCNICNKRVEINSSGLEPDNELHHDIGGDDDLVRKNAECDDPVEMSIAVERDAHNNADNNGDTPVEEEAGAQDDFIDLLAARPRDYLGELETGHYAQDPATYLDMLLAAGGEDFPLTRQCCVEQMESSHPQNDVPLTRARYSVPAVMDSDNNEITSHWSQGGTFKWMDTVASVIRVDVVMSDHKILPLLACNCLKKKLKYGDALLDNMEKLMSTLNCSREEGTVISANRLEDTIRQHICGSSLINLTEGRTALQSMECIHTAAVRAMIERKGEHFCASAIDLASDDAAEDYEADQEISYANVYKLCFPSDGTLLVHYNRQTPKQMAFSNVVSVNVRGKAKCARHERSSATCQCCAAVTTCLGNAEDNHLSKAGKDKILPVSWKKRPPSWNVEFCNDTIHVASDPNVKFPDVAIPCVRCTCSTAIPNCRTCRLQCECGAKWSDECEDAGNMVIHSTEKLPVRIRAKRRPCSNPCCSNKLNYDGLEDGVTVMYRSKSGELIAIDTVLLVDIVSKIHSSKDTLNTKLKAIEAKYCDRRLLLASWSLNFQSFQIGLWRCMRHLVLPFIPQNICCCPNCGAMPSAVNGDGTTVGVEKEKVDECFNEYPDQSSGVSMCNDRGKFSGLRGRLLVHCQIWKDLCVFSEDLCSIGEDITGFASGYTQAKKGSPRVSFNMADAVNLRNNVLANAQHEECGAIYYLLNNNIEKGISSIPQVRDTVGGQLNGLSGICQSFGAKSVAPICGGAGAALSWALSHLAMGGSCLDYIPHIFLSVDSPFDISLQDAESFLNNTEADDILEDEDEDYKARIRTLSQWSGWNLDTYRHSTVPVTCFPRGEMRSAAEFSASVAKPIMQSLHNHLAIALKRRSFIDRHEGDFFGDSEVSVVDFISKIFPHMASHLRFECPQFHLSAEVCAIAAHLSSKTWKLWSQPLTYIWAKQEERMTYAKAKKEERQFTIQTILSGAKGGKVEYKVTLKQIIDGRKRVSVTVTEDRNSGFYCASEALQRRLQLFDEFSMDNIQRTNADDGTRSKYRAPYGRLGICEKDFPTSNKWTPGLFIMTCCCSRKVVYICVFMDSGESPRTFFNIMLNRFSCAPPIVFYDNACHLQSYAMHRCPWFFFNTRFICDKLHQFNHSTCCWRYKCGQHTDIPVITANTQAVEQVNNTVKDHCLKTIRACAMENGVVYLSLFFTLFNRRQTGR